MSDLDFELRLDAVEPPEKATPGTVSITSSDEDVGRFTALCLEALAHHLEGEGDGSQRTVRDGATLREAASIVEERLVGA